MGKNIRGPLSVIHGNHNSGMTRNVRSNHFRFTVREVMVRDPDIEGDEGERMLVLDRVPSKPVSGVSEEEFLAIVRDVTENGVSSRPSNVKPMWIPAIIGIGT